MTTIEIKDASGKKAGTADLAASVFGIEPNVPVMHQVVRAQRASWRQGTHDTKTRGQVSGGGKKPWRQKGTGRARQGTIRAPQWAGGGTVFGPHPRSYAFRVNNKEVKLAMRSALSAKLADGELFVVDAFNFEKPSTKAAVAALLTTMALFSAVTTRALVSAPTAFKNAAMGLVLIASSLISSMTTTFSSCAFALRTDLRANLLTFLLSV